MSLSSSPVPAALFAPLAGLAERSAHHRSCPQLSDAQWLRLGVTRVLSDARSGRGFLQQFFNWLEKCPGQSLFFETLKSARRLAFLRDMGKQTARLLKPDATDRPGLKDFDLYAGDGHWQAAATHDAPVDTIKPAVGHLYALDLRTHALRHLSVADKPKENDMGAIGRLGAAALRLDAPQGRKVLWVWDRAGIHFSLWEKWKRLHGIYFISRTKDNMQLEVIGENAVPAEPINNGVISDHLVRTSQHTAVRRVSYRAPAGQTYEFITTELTLAPGLIAWLYLRRWELEKVYDQLKNKLYESKAWASGATAKTMQAELICLAHNLLTLFERSLRDDHGVYNLAAEHRAEQRRRPLRACVPAVSSLLTEVIRPLQRSLKLLRWLRAHWLSPAPLNESLAHLRSVYATY